MSVVATAKPPLSVVSQEPIRVMVVDDAVVVRGLVSRWIDAEPDLKIVASLRTGQEALERLEQTDPEVVLLDVEMPILDGISALPLLLRKKRNLVVIMVSTLTRRNAEVTLKALSLGAADYIPKPESQHEVAASATFQRDLVEKIRQLGWRRRQRNLGIPALGPPVIPAPPLQADGANTAAHSVPHALRPLTEIKLRPFPLSPPRVLLIGSSTGGPQALGTLIGGLNGVLDRTPVLITQHMPPTFTTILAEHIARMSGRPAHEAEDGEPFVAGTIYVAPGGKHMQVARRNGIAVADISDSAPINFCRPAVDPLFSSAAKVWGAWNLALVLTGMGSDGTHGAAAVVAAGGSVMAQDEATSVVWGMPGSVAHAGLCSAVLPLDRIAAKVVRLFWGDRQ
jgi:two-component system chemotaxis response regulator CheB